MTHLDNKRKKEKNNTPNCRWQSETKNPNQSAVMSQLLQMLKRFTLFCSQCELCSSHCAVHISPSKTTKSVDSGHDSWPIMLPFSLLMDAHIKYTFFDLAKDSFYINIYFLVYDSSFSERFGFWKRSSYPEAGWSNAMHLYQWLETANVAHTKEKKLVKWIPINLTGIELNPTENNANTVELPDTISTQK